MKKELLIKTKQRIYSLQEASDKINGIIDSFNYIQRSSEKGINTEHAFLTIGGKTEDTKLNEVIINTVSSADPNTCGEVTINGTLILSNSDGIVFDQKSSPILYMETSNGSIDVSVEDLIKLVNWAKTNHPTAFA